MPKQPLYPAHKDTAWSLGPSAAEQQPELTLLIGNCLIHWPYIEVQMSILLGVLLRANTDAAIAVYASIRQGNAKSDAISAAAKTVLEDKDYELFGAVVNIYHSVEKQRNALAHGCLGRCPKIADGILWVESKHYAKWVVSMMHKPIADHKYEDAHELGKHVFVYTSADLKKIYNDMVTLEAIVIDFVHYARLLIGRTLGAHETVREKRYRQQCERPRMAKELERLRAGQKNTQ